MKSRILKDPINYIVSLCVVFDGSWKGGFATKNLKTIC